MSIDEGWLIEKFLLELHKRQPLGAGGEYCDLCSNHGDIQWPCETVKTLKKARAEWRLYER